LNLFILRPVEQFVTNNEELIIEGVVESSEEQDVIVSIQTPDGLADLASLEESIQSLIVDLGFSRSLKSMILLPVFENGLSLAPRVVSISASDDGRAYKEMGIFNLTSGMGQDDGKAQVNFESAINARFIMIEMLESWQATGISLQEVRFLDSSNESLTTKVKNISIMLDLNDQGIAHFQTTILLREGENNISILSRVLDLEEDGEEEAAFMNITYIPEVLVEEESLILSDGYKAEIVIPPAALTPELKKIRIYPLDVNDIAWASYSDNLKIEEGTSPVVAYDIEMSTSSPFPVTAKDSLERQPPTLAVDGNPDYPSTWMSTTSALPIWLKVDLRSQHTIGKVVILPRVDGNVSYGPKRLSILISQDDLNYEEAGSCEDCDSNKVEVTLSNTPAARYVQIVIEDGNQGNNIQINEVEFHDEDGAKIVSYVPLSSVALVRPAELTIFYDDLDLLEAGVQMEENLAIFRWNEGMGEWQILGGRIDSLNNWVSVNLNQLSKFALFAAVPPLDGVKWSYNPFSPNGDGIADTTTISINIAGETGAQVKLEIFDYTAKLIRTLVHEQAGSGHISILWDGKDENGDYVSIGPYIYQVTVGKEIRNGVLVVAR
jgi:hypothetical protein